MNTIRKIVSGHGVTPCHHQHRVLRSPNVLHITIVIIYVSGHTSCRKCFKCFYVYLTISARCDIPQSKYKRDTRKRNRLNDLNNNSAAAYVEHAFGRPMLASYYASEAIFLVCSTARIFVQTVRRTVNISRRSNYPLNTTSPNMLCNTHVFSTFGKRQLLPEMLLSTLVLATDISIKY